MEILNNEVPGSFFSLYEVSRIQTLIIFWNYKLSWSNTTDLFYRSSRPLSICTYFFCQAILLYGEHRLMIQTWDLILWISFAGQLLKQYLPNLSFLGKTHQWGTHQMRSLDHVPYAPHVLNPESQWTIHFPRTYKSILFYLNKLLGMFMENLISKGLFPLATKYIFTLSFTFLLSKPT